MDELNGKKRVAGSLLVYELRQRRRALAIHNAGHLQSGVPGRRSPAASDGSPALRPPA